MNSYSCSACTLPGEVGRELLELAGAAARRGLRRSPGGAGRPTARASSTRRSMPSRSCRRPRRAARRCRRRRRRGRGCSSSSRRRSRSFSSISRRPMSCSPLRSWKPCCIIRRSAALRSPWYSRSSVISSSSASASRSKPTCVPSQREYRNPVTLDDDGTASESTRTGSRSRPPATGPQCGDMRRAAQRVVALGARRGSWRCTGGAATRLGAPSLPTAEAGGVLPGRRRRTTRRRARAHRQDRRSRSTLVAGDRRARAEGHRGRRRDVPRRAAAPRRGRHVGGRQPEDRDRGREREPPRRRGLRALQARRQADRACDLASVASSSADGLRTSRGRGRRRGRRRRPC